MSNIYIETIKLNFEYSFICQYCLLNIIHIPLFDKGSFFKFSETDVHLLHIYIYLFCPVPHTHSILSNISRLEKEYFLIIQGGKLRNDLANQIIGERDL